MKKKILLTLGMVAVLSLGASQLTMAEIGVPTCSLENCFDNPAAVITCHWMVSKGFCPAIGGPACCFV